MEKIVQYGDYKKILEEVNIIPVETNKWFPKIVADWINYNACCIGVSDVYISYPLITAVAYCSQHATVTLEDGMHSEPVLIYGLVAGRSGTNKSAALKKVTEMVFAIDSPNPSGHLFDTGTTEGLMKAMHDNNDTILSAKDEFASFNENFDKNSSTSLEKSRFLSLYSCTSWSRTTKNNGSISMQDPRFNLISFTQPYYAASFAKNSTTDGFFQRFLVSVPQEMFIKRNDKKKMMEEHAEKNELKMELILKNIYRDGLKKKILLVLSSEAERLYDEYHDSVVDYRKEDLFEERKVSIKSKSVGLVMRLSGVISLLRNYSEGSKSDNVSYSGNEQQNNASYDDIIVLGGSSILPASKREEVQEELMFEVTETDFKMALGITEYSVKTSFALLTSGDESQGPPGTLKSKIARKKYMKAPIPEPENATMDYALSHARCVSKFLSAPVISMNEAIRNKWYPSAEDVEEGKPKQGRPIGIKFVQGLENLGLGVLSPGKNHFKRFHYEDEECADRENLKKKYKMFNM